MGMIDTSPDIGDHLPHRPLSVSAGGGRAGGALRLLALLLLAAAAAIGSAVLVTSDRNMRDDLASLAGDLSTGLQRLLPQPAIAAMPVVMPAATPTLNGPLVLTSLTPDELMQTYPPGTGQSLTEGNFAAPAWQRYRRPALPVTAPHLGILLTGLGLNRALTAAAILYLPPDISLSFSPYAPELDGWLAAARAHGHEVLVDLPSESAAIQDDPGRDGLMTGLRPEENLARLGRILDRSPQIIGITTTLGSRFLTDPDALRPVLASLTDHGLAAVEASPDIRLQLAALDAIAHQPHLKASFAIDGAAGRDEILKTLGALAASLPQSSPLLTVSSPTPLSLALLLGWSRQLHDQGIALMPVGNMLVQ